MNYLGIDVGGSRIKTGVVNDAGEIIWNGSIEIPDTFAGFKQAIIDLYNEKKDEYAIGGVGISSCGGINPYTGDVTPCIAPKLQYLIGENYYELKSTSPCPSPWKRTATAPPWAKSGRAAGRSWKATAPWCLAPAWVEA